MPLLEAFPDEMQMMKYKLLTLPRGTAVMPILAGMGGQINEPQLATRTLNPETQNYLAGTQTEPSGYSFTISDARVVTATGFTANGTSDAAQALNAQNANMTITNGTATSKTVIGTICTITMTGNNVIFGTGNTLCATVTVIGLDSGARVQIPLFVTRTKTV